MTGTANFGGQLTIQLAYIPQEGDEITLLAYDGSTGEFTQVEVQSTTTACAISGTVSYGLSQLVLHIDSVSCSLGNNVIPLSVF